MKPHEHRTDSSTARLVDAREQFLGYIRKRIQDPELAEDILQDSLLRAMRAAPELRDEERLIPWFYRVLQNAIVDAYRRGCVPPTWGRAGARRGGGGARIRRRTRGRR